MYRNTFSDYGINVHIYWENQVNSDVFCVRNVVALKENIMSYWLTFDTTTV